MPEGGVTNSDQTREIVERNAETIDQTSSRLAFQLVELKAALSLFHRHMEDLAESVSGGVDAVQRSAAISATKELLAALRSSGFPLDKQNTIPGVNIADKGAAGSIASKRNSLTVREKQVLDLILGGATSREGALAINISPRTFEGHRAKIMQKHQAKNVADLISKVLENKIPIARPRSAKRSSN